MFPIKANIAIKTSCFGIVCEQEAKGHRTGDLGLSSATSTGNQRELGCRQRSLNSTFFTVPQGSCKAFRLYSTSYLLCKALDLRKLSGDLC